MKVNTVGRDLIQLFPFQAAPQVENVEAVQVTVKLGGRHKCVKLLVVEEIPITLTQPGVTQMAKAFQDQDVHLADNYETDEIRDIYMLIRADHYPFYILGMYNIDGVFLLKSPGGAIIYGSMQCTDTNHRSLVQSITVCRTTVQSIEAVDQNNDDLENIP